MRIFYFTYSKSYSGKEGKFTVPTGTVKWFSDQKGYGFIVPDDGGKDIFVHHTGIEGSGFKTLKEGDKVQYEVTQSPKGEQATNVTKA